MENHDLLILVDATASMTEYLRSLNTSLPQIISISALTGCFSRIGVIAFRDYDYFGDDLLNWSGWLHQNSDQDSQEPQPDLIEFVKHLKPLGNSDTDEAQKTALARAYELMRPDAKTLIFLYTDAPPHPNVEDTSRLRNTPREQVALNPTSFSNYGISFRDWVSASKILRDGPKQAQVFTILDGNSGGHDTGWYTYLCHITGGACTAMTRNEDPSKLTIDLLLAWMGVEKVSSESSMVTERTTGSLLQYESADDIEEFQSEKDAKSLRFFSHGWNDTCGDNIRATLLTTDILKKQIPKKTTPVLDFAKRWNTDPRYKDLVIRSLKQIINDNVQAMALNPVFGTLWRAVCNDREHEYREELLSAFSRSLEKIADTTQRASMKLWLEESYDFAQEITSHIAEVSEEDKYPCVFLDPTLSFERTATGAEDSPNSTSSLTRADLLEIGRSCNPHILRRMGTILTQMTVVESANDMPEHIASAGNEQVVRIPLAMAAQKYRNTFWKYLFHLIVPGTKLSARPAALVAALSLRMGVKPLAELAAQEVIRFKDKWNDISTPENWNIGCLTLLIDADEAHHRQQTERLCNDGPATNDTRLLNPSDKLFFERLVAFKLLESNLNSKLNAQMPWTPDKSSGPIGPLVKCRQCNFPRSVTIMGKDGSCGRCLGGDSIQPIEAGVSHDHTPTSNSTWVECRVVSCKAQYVVYAVKALNVSPKCHYCRTNSLNPAPTVKCNRCLNCMIWPKEYRPSDFDESEFLCPHCTAGNKPTAEVQVTANQLEAENTLSWLAEDTEKPNKRAFPDTSIFQTISTMGAEGFKSRITLFPNKDTKPSLIYKGKPIHNSLDLITNLENLVAKRKTIKTDCSLCFSSFKAGTLSPACGRTGCHQQICRSCLDGWYGLNTAGSIINTAALACPFCRRHPASNRLAKHGMGIQAVRDLALAVRDKGSLIYAWCRGCHTAKELMERSCARGAPPEVQDWACEECVGEWDRALLANTREGRARAEIEARMNTVKPCPKCETMTMRISGCGHMECSVEGCGAHWCYFCGKQFGYDVIYKHMSEEHGGFFGGEFEDEDEDEWRREGWSEDEDE
ncbi:uncharacterized protein N7511_004528 [Penicillium nucicola]|uniref:uncharacterized protein n=1 Tax=Penicillium nucicola TaxID=1850975 RepID=UPI00254557C6|nr:uncharacterized protein N7511_004528 [Penicillium nucicola]KAJ5766912.1 hypothetical protein N7511_004528 [Penicillium nucicola]